MTVLTCPSCENEIEPGEKREPTEEGAKHDYCVLHDSLFDKYHFSIINPPHKEGYSVSFWRVYDGEEFSVIQYSTDELVTVNSSSTLYSGAHTIQPSDEFFTAIAYTVHSIMAFHPFGPPLSTGAINEDKIQEEVDRHIDIFYDHKPPDHEVKVIKAAVTQLLPHSFPYVIEELKPIRDFAQECTKFDLPDVHPKLADPE